MTPNRFSVLLDMPSQLVVLNTIANAAKELAAFPEFQCDVTASVASLVLLTKCYSSQIIIKDTQAIPHVVDAIISALPPPSVISEAGIAASHQRVLRTCQSVLYSQAALLAQRAVSNVMTCSESHCH